MLIIAMVREKLESPRSSPKKKRIDDDEESKSPGKFKTPTKRKISRKFSPIKML